MRLRIPSIETNWLRRFCRWLPQPELALGSNPAVGGYYQHPFRGEILVGDVHVPADRGVIVLCASRTPDTIAHEWRHHWQRFCGWPPVRWRWAMMPGESYREAIVRYFRAPHELDALLFATGHAPDEVSLEWLDWIRADRAVQQ